MTDTVTIRLADACEIDALAQIWDESWKSTKVPSPEILSIPQLADRLREFMSSGAELYAVKRETKLVGLIVIDPAANKLSQLFLSRAAQNYGFGQTCLDFVKRRLPLGFALSVAEKNTKAIRFYERAGLVRESRIFRTPYQRYDVIFRWEP